MKGERLRAVFAAAALLLLLVAPVGCSVFTPPSPAATPTARPVATLAPASSPRSISKSGGKVTVYSALSESANSAMVAAFEAAQPVIGVEVLSLAAAGDLEAHIRSERDSPRADVFLGGSSEYHDPLGKDGLLEVTRKVSGAGSVKETFYPTYVTKK